MSVTQLLVTIWSPIPTCLYLQIPVLDQHELSLLVYRGGSHCSLWLLSTDAATVREKGPLRDLRPSVGAIPVMHSAMAMKEQERQERRGLTLLHGALFGLFVVGVVVAGGSVAFHALERRARVSSDSVATEESEENAIVQGLGIALWNEDPVTSQDISVGEEECTNPRAIQPLPVPRVSDLEQFQGEHRERLYWGTYRSMAYLGIRARAKESLLAGLMWAGVGYDGQYLGLRHYCEDTDNLKKWSWLRHDGSTYGRQVLFDHGLVFTTYFLKSSDQGSGYGGDWVARVKVESETEADKNMKEDRTESVFFYIADEAGATVNLWPGQDTAGDQSPFAGGYSDDFGNWELHAKYPEGVAMNYSGLRELYMPNLTQAVQRTLDGQNIATGSSRLPGSSVVDPNVAVIQLTGKLPFEVDIVFVSGIDERSHRIQKLTGSLLEEKLMAQELAFEERFNQTFKLQGKADSEEELETAKVALSNMLGSISYFYGTSRIQKPSECLDPYSSIDYWLYWNASLYTGVPARSTYPRGFLWDEGFHQLLISRWDRNISFEIIANWMDLINVDGWIPREQILGAEALSKVPADYVNQISDNANPPALLLTLRELAAAFDLEQQNGIASEADAEFFRTIFPRLEVWYNWFNTTQTGKEPDSYYWRGRLNSDDKLNPPTLTSGMDDYPRASHPSDDERHVDLRCWIANASDSMALLARVAGVPHQKYEVTATKLSNLTRLNELHYDWDTGRYYDYGNHTEKVELLSGMVRDPTTGITSMASHRIVLEPPKLGWVPQFGLNSLFPFAMHLIPADSPILGRHLEMLDDPELMWTQFGLRSLGSTSSIYMKNNSYFEAPYWRGPVWININYLVLSSLHDYSQEAGPYTQQATNLYQKLRKNLIRTIVGSYLDTGYIWEHYDEAAGGTGAGVHPFTGWSALVLRIIAELF